MPSKCLRLIFRVKPLLIFLFITGSATAQLYNDSGTIRIMDGSSMTCLGNVINASGTITNDGKLEIQGSFLNSSAYNSTQNEDSLLLTGAENVTLNSSHAMLNNLLVNKINAAVTLTANAAVGGHFDLLAGGFSTDPAKSYELVAPAAAAFTFGAGTQITGKVRRTNWVNGSKIVFHHPDMTVITTGGSAPAELLVNMIPEKNPTLAEKAVKRYFYFSPSGGSNYTADITFPYNAAELNTNTESNLVPWHYGQTKWNVKLNDNAVNTASHYVTSRGVAAGIFANSEWKLADVALGLGSLFVYPVPARGSMNISYTAERNGKAAIELLDVSGKVHKVAEKDMLKGFNKLSVNISGLSTGQYILKVEEGNAVQTKVVLIN